MPDAFHCRVGGIGVAPMANLGYWSDDVESDLATLESSGMRYEAKSYNPDGSGTLLWAYCKGATRPRIELVSRALEPFIEYWWSTADGPLDAS